jgi:hypothetical protein
MPEGPLGQVEIRGPLSDQACRMVIYVRGVGVPRNEQKRSQIVIDLVDNISQSGAVDTKSTGELVYANIPTGKNIVEVAVGLRDETYIPDQIQRSYNTVRNEVENLESVARISMSHISCGEPKEVLESKASATRF